MRRWFTGDKIAGMQVVLIVLGLAVALGMAWATTRGGHPNWFSTGDMRPGG